MAQKTLDLYRQYCLKLIHAGLQTAVGKPRAVVTDENLFRQEVVEPAWNFLPLPLRLLGRQKLRWDEYFKALRLEVFLAVDNKLTLRADTPARLEALARRLFGEQGGTLAAAPMATPTKPAAPAAPSKSALPLATPIKTAPVAPPPSSAPPATPSRTKPTTPPPMPQPQPAPAQAASPQPSSRAVVAASSATTQMPRQTKANLGAGVAVGIDLGTTYSVVAYVDAHGRPCSIANAVGDIITPSVVLFDDGGPVVGKEAVLAAAMEPEKIAICVKRDMGSKYFRHKINGEHLPPEVISSLILRSLKADAERKLGSVTKAVITVPAYFDESRRRATMDAGKLAGLDVLDILNEPTAAAIAYGYQLGFLDPSGRNQPGKPLRVLVYDLGGGTFDVTIVEINGNSFRALATDGDVTLGGKDWDEEIVNFAAQKFIDAYREDPRGNPSSMQDLWLAAEGAKKTLSERPKATMFVNHLGQRLKVEMTRDEFEEATAALLSRTCTTVEIVVRQAGLNWAAIDKVLMVGGSTRMPQVARMFGEVTGRPPERSVEVDEAVAHGAALYANLLLKQRTPTAAPPQFSVTNINSHSLGIVGVDPATGRKRNQILIPKNTPLPTTVARVFKTAKHGQANVVIRVVEGESERPEACISIGTCTIDGLPANLPAGAPVEVRYSYQTNGQLEVSGHVQGAQTGATTVFQRENSLDQDQMTMWLQYVSAGE